MSSRNRFSLACILMMVASMDMATGGRAKADNPSVVTWRAVLPPDPSAQVLPENRPLHQKIVRRVHLRRLDAEIRMAAAVVKSYQRRVAEYEKFGWQRDDHPLFLTLENARLDLLEASERLLELKRIRSDLFRARHQLVDLPAWNTPAGRRQPSNQPARFSHRAERHQ